MKKVYHIMGDKEQMWIKLIWVGVWRCFFPFGPSTASKDGQMLLAGVRFRRNKRQW